MGGERKGESETAFFVNSLLLFCVFVLGFLFFCDGLHFVFNIVFHFVFSSSPFLSPSIAMHAVRFNFVFDVVFYFVFDL